MSSTNFAFPCKSLEISIPRPRMWTQSDVKMITWRCMDVGAPSLLKVFWASVFAHWFSFAGRRKTNRVYAQSAPSGFPCQRADGSARRRRSPALATAAAGVQTKQSSFQYHFEQILLGGDIFLKSRLFLQRHWCRKTLPYWVEAGSNSKAWFLSSLFSAHLQRT